MNGFLIGLLIFFSFGAGIVFFILLTRKPKTDKGQTDAIKGLEQQITVMVGQIKEISSAVGGTSTEMNKQITSFTQEATRIREDLKQVQSAVKEVSSFQDIFKSPKLRGQWGEANLEHILSQHFPSELCKRQYLFSSGEQVDIILKLPNGKILPIDAKFPVDNFLKMANTASDTEKNFYNKSFLEDVKARINEISSKYILPSENTVDFALMYIPAEAVYYEIINNMSREIDISAYAWSKKVILTSPNTIYLTLRTIEHWFKDTQISRQTQEILNRLARINQDAAKLMDDFRKLGGHIRNAGSAYDNSEKRLSLFSERVEKLIETGETKYLKQTKEI